jgi:dihydroxyacetone kinase
LQTADEISNKDYSETGRIDIPLICTCKKALISIEENEIDFGNVIFGEQSTRYLKIKNKHLIINILAYAYFYQ